MARLVIQRKGKVLKEVSVYKPQFSIGREPHCDVFLQHDSVSRRHAEIQREGDEYYIEDHESTNGTLVNRLRIERQRLRDGDVIAIGKFRLRFDRDTVTEAGVPESGVVEVTGLD